MTSARGLTLLGLDYGERRIGAAVGETVGASTRALGTVAVRDGQPDWAALGRLMEDWAPDRIVLGLPVREEGGEHPLSAAVTRFARRLAGRYGRPVDTVDERLSSVEAGHREAAGAGGGIDALAAQVILETWMEEHARGQVQT